MSAPEIDLYTATSALPGMQRRTAESLAFLGLTNVGKLVDHLPSRHVEEHAEAPIAELKPGVVGSARGEVTSCRKAGFARKQRFEAVLADDSGRVELIFFNQPYLAGRIHAGDRLLVQGAPKLRGETLQLANPMFEVLKEDAEPDQRQGAIKPVYPATESLASKEIAKVIDRVLDDALPFIDDHLEDDYRRARSLPELREAYRLLHRPETEAEIELGRERLIYDEFLLLQLAVHMRRAKLRQRLSAPALERTADIDERIRSRIPFDLTPAQNKVVEDLRRDLSVRTPTNRLIQGDVGSGKTAVALYAMLMSVASGHQASLMAPTTILAEQHFGSISRMLEGSSVRVELLTGSTPRADRDAIVGRARAGELDILIGTHALIEDAVEYESLGVAIVDEQHRFGVRQRARMRSKAGDDSTAPHLLVMTATPIPRTISMTLFGDLDVSTIDGLPPGRSPTRTELFHASVRDAAYLLVREAAERGEQSFVVAPAIEAEELQNVEALADELTSGFLSGLRVRTLHGRMHASERDAIMADFRDQRFDVLIATTVIEVGVDVPNATCIVIEQADRFGLAQLHQLRGRVGRGDKPGVCALVADPVTDDGTRRLEAIQKYTDGFKLAEADLEIRGIGDLFGTRQSGLSPFRLADPIRDLELLEQARRDAAAWIAESPDLDRAEDETVKRRMMRAHGAWLDLGDVG